MYLTPPITALKISKNLFIQDISQSLTQPLKIILQPPQYYPYCFSVQVLLTLYYIINSPICWAIFLREIVFFLTIYFFLPKKEVHNYLKTTLSLSSLKSEERLRL